MSDDPEPIDGIEGYDLDGTKVGVIEGYPIVDRQASDLAEGDDAENDYRAHLVDVCMGDGLSIDGETYEVVTHTSSVNPDYGLVSFMIRKNGETGPLDRLYVDRKPFLLDEKRGGVFEVDPEDVEALLVNEGDYEPEDTK